MAESKSAILLDFSNPSTIKAANEVYKKLDVPVFATNQEGEGQLISFAECGVTVVTFQNNGWTRKNYYTSEGYPEGESFEERWK